MKCHYEYPESSTGAADAFLCGRPALIECSECGVDVCALHHTFCTHCMKPYCSAEMDSRCFDNHVCVKPVESETLAEMVERIAG